MNPATRKLASRERTMSLILILNTSAHVQVSTHSRYDIVPNMIQSGLQASVEKFRLETRRLNSNASPTSRLRFESSIFAMASLCLTTVSMSQACSKQCCIAAGSCRSGHAGTANAAMGAFPELYRHIKRVFEDGVSRRATQTLSRNATRSHHIA